jgi:hypothetical protein
MLAACAAFEAAAAIAPLMPSAYFPVVLPLDQSPVAKHPIDR